MVGTSSSARAHVVDRFYNPPAIRRQLQLQQEQQCELQRQPQKAARPKLRPSPQPAAAEVRVPDDRVESDALSSKPPVSSSPPPSITPPPPPSPDANLDRFLESTTPTVPAQYLPKMSLRSWRNCNGFESQQPYFCLGDLWESFREWSAYGAGVPLVLDGSELVVQYYVPYLSGIQLYLDSSKVSMTSRKPGDDSDGEPYLDTSSEDSSESEAGQHTGERSYLSHIGQNPNFGDDCEGCNIPVLPIFEYLERDPPYGREPLSDKISVLTSKFPNLKMYKSCDLHPSSWLSVAWYPIYRIPMGPTLRDLDACFLTFHSLATPLKSSSNGHSEVFDYCNIRNITATAKLQLPAFGLAPYKLKGSIWTSSGLHERQLASSLLQAADDWLRLLQVDHPDFRFFLSHHNTIRG